MRGHDGFRFRIAGVTPETLSQRRLGEYLVELARLYGCPDHVHFARLLRGSAVVCSVVDRAAITEVRGRLRSAADVDPPKDVASAKAALGRLLSDDGASATLRDVGAGCIVLSFPLEKVRPARIGPISQRGAIEGRLVWVGGADRTAHAHVETDRGAIACVVTHELARRLGYHLFQRVRLTGSGRWFRNPDGHWEIDGFRADDFEQVEPVNLVEAFNQLRAVAGNGWQELEDPLREAAKLRRA